jgi:hypothetical protein
MLHGVSRGYNSTLCNLQELFGIISANALFEAYFRNQLRSPRVAVQLLHNVFHGHGSFACRERTFHPDPL